MSASDFEAPRRPAEVPVDFVWDAHVADLRAWHEYRESGLPTLTDSLDGVYQHERDGLKQVLETGSPEAMRMSLGFRVRYLNALVVDTQESESRLYPNDNGQVGLNHLVSGHHMFVSHILEDLRLDELMEKENLSAVKLKIKDLLTEKEFLLAEWDEIEAVLPADHNEIARKKYRLNQIQRLLERLADVEAELLKKDGADGTPIQLHLLDETLQQWRKGLDDYCRMGKEDPLDHDARDNQVPRFEKEVARLEALRAMLVDAAKERGLEWVS